MSNGPEEGWTGFVRTRDRAIRSLRGRVLELGAGDGVNFAQLHPGVEWTGLEPSATRRRMLTRRADRHGHRRPPLAAAAEQIPLPDASMDSVFATVVLCSVSDQDRVLAEAARVLVPGGRLVLAEHVAAPPGTSIRRLQRLARPWTKLLDHGCDPARDTETAVRRSPLLLRSVARFGVPVLGQLRVPFLVIEAVKASRVVPRLPGLVA